MLSVHQRTPLHAASVKGHLWIMQTLYDHGADFNIKDDDGVSERDYYTEWVYIDYREFLQLFVLCLYFSAFLSINLCVGQDKIWPAMCY